MGEGQQSNSSWKEGEVSGEMKQGRGNERLCIKAIKPWNRPGWMDSQFIDTFMFKGMPSQA